MEFTTIFLLICSPIAFTKEYTYSPDIPGDIYTILFGNLSELNNFFHLNPDEQTELQFMAATSRRTGNSRVREFGDFDYILDGLSKNFTYDLKDFRELKARRNATRRILPGLISYGKWGYDPRDNFENGYYWREREAFERSKISRVKDTNHQFLAHARYKISFVLKQRETYRKDVRYQLGYLFNRLKRLHIYEKNVMNMAKRHYFLKRVDSATKYYGYRKKWVIILRLYERMIHLDVDIKDIINTVKKLDRKLQDEYHDVQEFLKLQSYMDEMKKGG